MKVKQYSALLAILMTSGLIHAQTTIPVGPPGPGAITAPLTIQGTVTVTPAPTPPTATGDGAFVPATANTDVQLPAPNGALNYKITPIGNGGQVQQTITGGGVVLNPNGDVNLNEQSNATQTISYQRATRFQYVRPGQSIVIGGVTYTQGDQIPNSQEVIAVRDDGNGNFITLGVLESAGVPTLISEVYTVGGVPVLDGAGQPILILNAAALAALPPADLTAITSSTPPVISGGNLTVQGNTILGNSPTDTTTVNGALVANNGLDATNDKITNLAAGTVATDAANLGQVNAGDATLQTNINSEATTRAAADATLTTNLATEVTARTNADTTLTTNLANEVTARTSADTTLTTNLANEVTARTNADTTLTTNLANEVTARTNADTTLTTNLANEVTARTNADTTLTTNLANEVTARTNADTTLTTNLANEVTARAAADTAIRGEVAAADNLVRTQFAAADTALGTAVRSEFAAADTALGGRIDSEISARIAGDTTVRSEFVAADTLIRTQFAAADTALGTAVRNEFAAADTTERNARIAGDSTLQSNIDENTRGIAMVAAMTNTQVAAGKTHGVDFNMAQFQSETGFGFGYANRINENVQVHTSVASTTDFDESVVRVGVAYQW
jgi:hypothetical protein